MVLTGVNERTSFSYCFSKHISSAALPPCHVGYVSTSHMHIPALLAQIVVFTPRIIPEENLPCYESKVKSQSEVATHPIRQVLFRPVLSSLLSGHFFLHHSGSTLPLSLFLPRTLK